MSVATDSRYHRQSLIDWWDQERVRTMRVLVVGAGAIGNEVLKLLALTGVGHTTVFDPDCIEHSNLSRSVLFRDGDEGRAKASVAVERMRVLNPDIEPVGYAQNVIGHAGLALFESMDVVIGAVDNREARVFINTACARVGRVWIDAAIEGFMGVVRGFDPARGACYECTMNATDRKILAQRRSCAMLARAVHARGHVPTTAVAASLVAALQVQEAIKLVHGQPVLLGEGLHFDGLTSDVSRVKYPRKSDCPAHDALADIESFGRSAAELSVGELLARAEAACGPDAVVDLSRDVVTQLRCVACDRVTPFGAALGTVGEAEAACPSCRQPRIVDFTGSLYRGLDIDHRRTLADIGVPPRDIVVARNGVTAQRAWRLGGVA